MKVSIVIPTLNEEKMLPKLLESIRAQNFEGYEVIIADAHSKDRTRELAQNYGCRVVDGGLPAAGRNAGAAAAAGEYLFFLDADVILPPGFISNVYSEMRDRYIELATCEIRPLSNYRLDRVIHRLINLMVILNLWIDPKAFGFCIFVSRGLFRQINGFDETIYVAEDNDFVKRGSVYRPLRYLSSAHILVSIRRFEKEGRFAYMKKGIKLNLYRTFRGEIRSDEVVKYEFGAFDKEDTEDTSFLDKLEERLLKVEERSRRFSRLRQPQEGEFRERQQQLNEYSHIVKKLKTYFTKQERRARWKRRLRRLFSGFSR